MLAGESFQNENSRNGRLNVNTSTKTFTSTVPQRHAKSPILEASIGERTKCVYERRLKEYEQFCTIPGLERFSKSSITQFLAKLQLDGKTHSTFLSYISAKKFNCRRHGKTHILDGEVVRAKLKGIKNLETNAVTVKKACTKRT